MNSLYGSITRSPVISFSYFRLAIVLSSYALMQIEVEFCLNAKMRRYSGCFCGSRKPKNASTSCYVDVKPIIYEASFFLMTLLLPDQRETCCYAWHGTGPSHLLGMRPSLRHKAPGSL